MNASEEESDSQRRTVVKLIIGIVVAVVVSIPLLMCAGFGMMVFSITNHTSHVISDPAAEFTQITGLTWPSGAQVVSFGDEHGGFNGDGELHIVFETDRPTIDAWVAQSPPWNQPAWESGPVPTEIGSHCYFHKSEIYISQTDGGPWAYEGDPELVRLLSSANTRYTVEERCCNSLRWHNGSLLVFDLDTNRVWLSVWDY